MPDLFWLPVLCAGVLAGGSCGVLGVFIVGLRVPFLAVCVAHGALAGAVYGALAGLHGPLLLAPALAAAAGIALLLGWLDAHGVALDSNVALAVLFSLSLGLAFLGLGLFAPLGRSDNEVRNLLWGSLLFCRWRDVGVMAGASTALAAFVGLFYKELRALLFSRWHAAGAGVRVGLVWTGLLLVTSVILTVYFQTVGGLMIYSLVTCPALAAFLLVRGCGRALATAALLGAAAGLGGFLIARRTDLPVGATIVIVAALLVAAAALLAHLRNRGSAPKPH